MRYVLIGLVVLGACCPAQAGVYNLDPNVEPQAKIPAERVVAYVFGLRALAVPPQGPVSPESPRARYERQVAELEKARARGALSATESVNLSAAYIRLGKLSQAIRVLRAADPKHPLVQANLAGAYQAMGELQMAVLHQRRALKQWPADWVSMAWLGGPAEVESYRECENYNLRLLENRLREEARKPGGDMGVDPIFPGVRFIVEDDKGNLVNHRDARLPRHAINIVLQLLLWQPQDPRLQWLLAEVLYADGYLEPAFRLMDDLVFNRGQGGREVRAHSKAMRKAVTAIRKLVTWQGRSPLLTEAMLIPRPTLAPGGAGAAAYQVSTLAPMVAAPEADKPPPPPGNQGAIPDGFLSPPPVPFNWRHAGISFVFGALVAVLLGLQIQQWRRYRRAAVTAGDEAAESTEGATHVLDNGTAAAAADGAHPDRPEGIRRVP
jgi:tetratricopeptide (TPR) repeat protein